MNSTYRQRLNVATGNDNLSSQKPVARPQMNLTPANWYVILKKATQSGYNNIWDFLDSMKK